MFTFFFATFSNLSFGGNNNPAPDAKSPEFVVKDFYSEYLTAWNDPDIESGTEKSQNAINIYTTKYIQKLKGEDDSGVDYFTNVQGICPEWVNEISTNVSSLDKEKAVIELMLGHSASESKYKINLVRANGKWLIDSVLFVSNATGYCSDN